MSSFMRVRDKNTGQIINIPLGGIAGKSAYAYAKEAGYTGTEEEFANKMAKDCIVYGDTEEMHGGYTMQVYYDPDDVGGNLPTK